MKAALIPPTPALKRYGLGDFHLLLSHLLEDPHYFIHYRRQRDQGAYLVLDNSAHGNFHLAEAKSIVVVEEVRRLNVVPSIRCVSID